MHVKLKVIKGRDTSYAGKQGRVERYSLTCSDPEETMLDNVDVNVPMDVVSKLGPDAVNVKGKTLDFIVESIREGFQRIEFSATPVLTATPAQK